MQSYLSWFLFFSSHPLCFVCLFMYVLSFDCSTMLYRAVRAEIFTSLCLYFCFSLVDIFIYSSSLGFLFFSISRLFYSILFSTPFIPVLYLRANKSNGGPFHNAIIFFSSSFRCCCCLRTPCHTINIHWPLLPNTRARNVHTYIVPSRTSPQKRRRQKQFTGLKNRHHKRHTTTTNTKKISTKICSCTIGEGTKSIAGRPIRLGRPIELPSGGVAGARFLLAKRWSIAQ